ncbi:MAG: DNA (cytosine-5-)-methyltransferase, partial [Desulfobacteraceae bacterium]|nr:DNA (cytosine-5-)-methyltransferase [Desulfobacteraceae bacterium]
MTNEKELTHIDLFSGIGGFTIAAKWAGFRTVVFCEKEKFCQKVLKKHWPEIPIIPEIRDFNGTKYRDATLLTGGFPCQPFSVVGQRRGKKDDRYLWPEMLKVIDEAKPRWILAENVPGIFRMALDTVLSDLEGEGYATGTFIIPACGLNAPHRRNRVWIIAYSESRMPRNQTEQKGWKNFVRRDIEIDPNSDTRRIRRHKSEGIKKRATTRSNNEKINRYAYGNDVQRAWKQSNHQESSGLYDREKLGWEENWFEIAAHFCRVDDGISDRIHRLKALG